jgi:hypothetical protein
MRQTIFWLDRLRLLFFVDGVLDLTYLMIHLSFFGTLITTTRLKNG